MLRAQSIRLAKNTKVWVQPAAHQLVTPSFSANLPSIGGKAGFANEVPESPHFSDPKRYPAACARQFNADGTYTLPHPIYDQEAIETVDITHREPEKLRDRLAYGMMKVARTAYDRLTGYGVNMTEEKYLRRFLFLESIAGVPGMVGGMWRHCTSLRKMTRDYGWIHTLLEEAENERVHLLTFMQMRDPPFYLRFMVLMAQGVFFNLYFLTYILNPKACHRFVGYLEEEAVKTYTGALKDLDQGTLPGWSNMDAPAIAKQYWKLGDNAKMRDVLLAVRADEAVHREVNHTFADIPADQPNPFANEGQEQQQQQEKSSQ